MLEPCAPGKYEQSLISALKLQAQVTWALEPSVNLSYMACIQICRIPPICRNMIKKNQTTTTVFLVFFLNV